jgi:hypothetical protein
MDKVITILHVKVTPASPGSTEMQKKGGETTAGITVLPGTALRPTAASPIVWTRLFSSSDPTSLIGKNDSPLQALHRSLYVKLSHSLKYMIGCALLMIFGVVFTLLIGLNLQYNSPVMMVLFQLMALTDVLRSLCEIKILSIAIEKI